MSTITTRTQPSIISMHSLPDVNTEIKTTQFGDKIKNVTQNERKPHSAFSRITHNLVKLFKFISNISNFISHKSAEKNITQNTPEFKQPKIYTSYQAINKQLSDNLVKWQSVPSGLESSDIRSSLSNGNYTLSQSMPMLSERIDQPEAKTSENKQMSASLPSIAQQSSSTGLVTPISKSSEHVVSSLLGAISQTKLKSVDKNSSPSLNNPINSLKDEKQGIETVMEQLKSRLEKIRDAVAPDDDTNFQKPMNKIQLEIMNERKKYNSEAAVKERAKLDAREEEKVAAALKAESESNLVEPTKEFIAELRLDKNNIPLPPPLPGASINKPSVMTSVKTALQKENNEPKEHSKNYGNLIDELQKRFAGNSITQDTGGKLQVKPGNRFSQEIARLKSQDAQSAEQRKQADAEADARVEKAIKVQAEAAELMKIKAENEAKAKALAEAKERELIANTPRDARNIPVPPPLPSY